MRWLKGRLLYATDFATHRVGCGKRIGRRDDTRNRARVNDKVASLAALLPPRRQKPARRVKRHLPHALQQLLSAPMRLCARNTPLLRIHQRRVFFRQARFHHSRRNVVECISRIVKLSCDLPDCLAIEPRRIMDVHSLHLAALLRPEAGWIPENGKVVVRLPRLEDRLAAHDVCVERAHLAPYRIARVHLQARIKAPARPDGLHGRIATAMVEDVIHAREEKPVEKLLDLRRPFVEVLVYPRTRFGRNKRCPLDVRRRRGKLRDEDVAGVLAEHLRLRYVGKRVKIEPVARRAMRLVARHVSILAAPVRPHLEAAKLRIVDIRSLALRLGPVVFVAVVVERAGTRRRAALPEQFVELRNV